MNSLALAQEAPMIERWMDAVTAGTELHGGAYFARARRTHRVTQWEPFPQGTEIANFVAIVVGEGRDFECGGTRFYRIAGVCDGVGRLNEVTVGARQFASLEWIAPSWGLGPIIAAGKTEQVAEAILRFSAAVRSDDRP